jgi:hypothetical protein
MGHAADASGRRGGYLVAMNPEVRWTLLQLTLWYCVVAWSTWFGGTLYQMLVVVPMWSENPPASVQAFFGRTRYPRTIRRFFGPKFMAARVIPMGLALALAWSFPVHQCALAIAFGCVAGAVVHTRFWVYPINEQLIDRAGDGLSAGEVRSLAHVWITHDRLRFVVGCVALAALLFAFQLPATALDAGEPRPAPGAKRQDSSRKQNACVDPSDAFIYFGGDELEKLDSLGLICDF